jgi:transposase
LTGSPLRSVRRRFSSPSWAPPIFTYAEASWTQALADWIGAHTRAFAALGGVPKLLVPDNNTKVAVIKACLYEPQVNRTYAEMAAHYDTAILPARPRRPRDKAKSLPQRRLGSKSQC